MILSIVPLIFLLLSLIVLVVVGGVVNASVYVVQHCMAILWTQLLCVFIIIRYEIYRKILNFICLYGNFITYLLILCVFVFNQFFVYLFIKFNDNISWLYCCFYGKIILYNWRNLLFYVWDSMLLKIAHSRVCYFWKEVMEFK